MTLDEMKFWTMVAFQVMNAFASSGLWLYVRFGDRNKQIDQRFERLARDHDKRSDQFEQRLAHIEGQLERAPTHTDLAGIHEKVNATNAKVSEMAGQLQGISDTLRLILARIAERGMN